MAVLIARPKAPLSIREIKDMTLYLPQAHRNLHLWEMYGKDHGTLWEPCWLDAQVWYENVGGSCSQATHRRHYCGQACEWADSELKPSFTRLLIPVSESTIPVHTVSA